MSPRLSVVFLRRFRVWMFPCLLDTDKCHPNSERSTVLLWCQLPTNFHNIIIVKGVCAPGVCSSWTICGVLVCCQPPSLLIGRVWVPGIFCACPIHCKVHWRVDRRLGQGRMISVQFLIGSTIRTFSISSALFLLEVQCCLYCHSFYQTNYSTLWWMVIGVNCLTLYQECSVHASVF